MSTTEFKNVRIFDGRRVIEQQRLVIVGGIIAEPGFDGPVDVTVDGSGRTLLPGLFDAHVHTSLESLALALRFGVTTELEMQGFKTPDDRAAIAARDDVADVRTAGFGITPPGGHPSELFPPRGDDGPDEHHRPRPTGPAPVMPLSSTPAEAVAWIPKLVESGSDYIKFMVDDGTVEGAPGLPMLTPETLRAGVQEAHRLGKLAIAHALTLDATRIAIDAGVDGLAHVFMDQPHTPDIIATIAESGAFVVPCIVLNASMIGITGARFAEDPRVASKLDEAWLATLRSCFGHYPQGSLDDILETVQALHTAGVDLLVGTDVSQPLPFLGGLAHGASVHHEMQLLVQAGLTPAEALTAATATPARRFGFTDRGHLAPGLRADLLLVEGDPTADIGNTLSIEGIWRRGTPLPEVAV